MLLSVLANNTSLGFACRPVAVADRVSVDPQPLHPSALQPASVSCPPSSVPQSDLSMELNSTTLKGRANVAKLTLGGLAAVGIYFKMRGGSKVSSPR